MTDFDSPIIVVSAVEHPEVDDWVVEQARAEAAQSGVALWQYLGREGSLPEPRPPDLCCHVFSTRRQPERPVAER